MNSAGEAASRRPGDSPARTRQHRISRFYEWCARAYIPEVTTLGHHGGNLVAGHPGVPPDRDHQRRTEGTNRLVKQVLRCAHAVRAARRAGASGRVVVRADSAYYNHQVVAAARRLVLHLPRDWPWEPAWQQMFIAVHAPPAAA